MSKEGAHCFKGYEAIPIHEITWIFNALFNAALKQMMIWTVLFQWVNNIMKGAIMLNIDWLNEDSSS